MKGKTLTVADYSAFAATPTEEIFALAKRPLAALYGIPPYDFLPAPLDDSGIARRGSGEYFAAIDGKFTRRELSAANRWLLRMRASWYIIDQVHIARVID